MRITNNMLVNNMINYIGNNLRRMEKYQYQMATGKKISVPSDDPVVAARALKLRTDVSEIAQYKRNVEDAMSWLDITESTISNIGDVLQRVRELTVQAANGTNTPDETVKIEREMSQLRTQLIHMANTTYAGRYVFSGYKTDKPLLDETTGKFLIDVSNSEIIQYEIGIGDDMDVNVAGGDLFNAGMDGIADTRGTSTGNAVISNLTITAGVNDVLNLSVDGTAVSITIPPNTYGSNEELAAEIEELVNAALPADVADIRVTVDAGKLVFTSGSTGDESVIQITGGSAAADLGVAATTQVDGVSHDAPRMIQTFDKLINALKAGDSQVLSSLLTDIDEEIKNILRVRADVGARQNRLELTSNRLDGDNLNFTGLMSKNEDVDMAETIMNLKNEENVYRASLAGGARIIMPTLVDFLR